MKKLISGVMLSALALTAVTAMAQQNHYPNLESAQQTIDQAIGRIEAARHDTRDGFGGHASKAEALLREAKAELNQAAAYRGNHR
jgi:hypothetical protein